MDGHKTKAVQKSFEIRPYFEDLKSHPVRHPMLRRSFGRQALIASQPALRVDATPTVLAG
jgi:hypothetical protein